MFDEVQRVMYLFPEDSALRLFSVLRIGICKVDMSGKPSIN